MDNSLLAAKAAHKGLDDKFGKDIVILDIREISILADYFVIASASNPSQMKAMADACEQELFKLGITLNHAEGTSNSSWYLLDFNCVIVHIFSGDDRAFYNLERIWGDAPVIDVRD